MKSIVIWIWCLPQMLLGLIVKLITRAKRREGYYVYNLKCSAALGEYIFISRNSVCNERILKHEQGHAKQSRLLGWLYLFVIGLPSLIWNVCFRTYRRKHNKSYYTFYTERWADKLGGVQ